MSVKLDLKIPDQELPQAEKPAIKKGDIQLNSTVTISKAKHDALVAYLIERLDAASDIHANNIIPRYTAIDKEVAGFIRLDNDDRRRQRDVMQGKGAKPFATNLQLVKNQMDEAVTYVMAIFFPQEGPYNVAVGQENQSIAKGLSVLMNKQNKEFSHFTNVAKAVYDGYKYNSGLWELNWKRIKGNRIKNDASGQYELERNTVIKQGNEIHYLDPYNTLYDPMVPLSDLRLEGEFYATVHRCSMFKAMISEKNGFYYNIEAVKSESGFTKSYYTDKPDIIGNSIALDASASVTNWVSVLSAGQNSGNVFAKDMLEIVRLRIWLLEESFDLGVHEQYQLWEIHLANGRQIIFAERMETAHGELPIHHIRLWDDNFDGQTQSFAEMLLPYQRFASFQMNIHQHAARRALYGLLFFDKDMFPGLREEQFDQIAGRIGFNGGIEGRDINKGIKQIFDAPDTQNTLRDVDAMDSLMQKFLPTQLASQVASLERATKYQAAATVQAASGRNLKSAVMVDAQAYAPTRRQMTYNILQHQTVVKVSGPNGEELEINPTELRNHEYIFEIEAGLHGLDKLVIVETFKDIVFAILQNPPMTQKVDILKLLDYMTTQMGDHTDLTQFKFQNQFDALSEEEKAIAFQLLQQATQAQAEEQGTQPTQPIQ